ncbi:Guanine nucleotide-binding protein subunit gamma [Entomophthora muscae]|uniref:Guanine nucleotide-binding protein subunit gamma n=1 Tax=Entomophthora muscae TaxID=34485 RepID=A0ACC2RGN6_9FUNG|nr:Guanine nucleotide-binding protein subunit gamma [Entomophthora muscae]
MSGRNRSSQEKLLKKLLAENSIKEEMLNSNILTVSEASKSLIEYTKTTRDFLVPSIWGTNTHDPFNTGAHMFCKIL